MTIGQRIKGKRQENGLTLRNISEKSGLSVSFLSDIENDRRRPSLDRLTDLAKGLETTVSYLLGEEELKEKDKKKTIYSLDDKSMQFREVLAKIDDFDSWREEDKEELLTYLKLKEKIRYSKRKGNSLKGKLK